MAHFAKVTDGIVQRVIVADQEFIDNYNDGEPGEWIQTSYNTRGGIHYQPNSNTPSEDQSKALRKNFAGPGFVYDAEQDVFYAPQPYPSWTLNSGFIWEPPVEYPADSQKYVWNEDNQSWDSV
jgi:hypothetical protein